MRKLDRITIEISKEDKRRLKVVLAQQGRTISKFLRDKIKEYLS